MIESEFPDFNVPEKMKELQVKWETTSDHEVAKPETTNLTLRKLLSQVSKPFAPFGIIKSNIDRREVVNAGMLDGEDSLG